MLTPAEALARLEAGNRRFVAGERTEHDSLTPEGRAALAEGQSPVAVVLACSDSRVPVEMVFDQGIGDLFVIRVAGNIVGASQIGSVEFAVDALGARLVVVLGHSGCGAVGAALQEEATGQVTTSPALRSILDRIRPVVRGMDDVGDAVWANVAASVAGILSGSETLRDAANGGDVRVVGAVYDLESGEVDFD
jgi:carbonic anhydrase